MPKPYYIEGTTTLWIRDDLAPFGTNVYYIQKIAGYTPNGSAIFDFFDHFTTYDTSVWTTLQGSPTVASSILTLNSTTANPMIRSLAQFGPDNIFEARVSHVSGNGTIFGFWSASPDCRATWLGVNGASNNDWVYTKNGTTATLLDDSVNRTGTTYYKYGIAYLKDSAKFYVDGTLRRTQTATLPYGNLNLTFYGTVNKGNLLVDYVRIRKYAPVEPTVTVVADGSNYKVIVRNGCNKDLRGYQIAIPASSLGTLTETTSVCVDNLFKSQGRRLYSNLLNNSVVNTVDMQQDLTTKHTLTNSNVTAVVDRFGCAGNACSYNGTSSFTTIANATDLDLFNVDNFTILQWVKQVGSYPSSSATLLGKGSTAAANRWNFDITNNEVIPSIQDSDSVLSVGSGTAVTLNDGSWHLLGIVRSGTNVLLYKDGELVRTIPLTGITNFSSTYDMFLGVRNGTLSDQYANVQMGQFVIINGTSYTAAQMKRYYDLSKVGYVYPAYHSLRF